MLSFLVGFAVFIAEEIDQQCAMLAFGAGGEGYLTRGGVENQEPPAKLVV